MSTERALERSRRLVLPEFVARNARRAPDAPALDFEDERRTFAELDERSSRLANALAAHGVQARDQVAVLMRNRLEFVEAFLGIQKLGACAVPVNFRLVPEEVAYVLGHSRSVGVIADQDVPGVAGVRFTLHTGEEYEAALAGAAADAPDVVVDDDDLAFLMYTSG